MKDALAIRKVFEETLRDVQPSITEKQMEQLVLGFFEWLRWCSILHADQTDEPTLRLVFDTDLENRYAHRSLADFFTGCGLPPTCCEEIVKLLAGTFAKEGAAGTFMLEEVGEFQRSSRGDFIVTLVQELQMTVWDRRA